MLQRRFITLILLVTVLFLPMAWAQNASEVKESLDEMVKLDQNIRSEIAKSPDKPELTTQLQEIDHQNTAAMKKILAEHGWMTISTYGEEYDNKAWLLVQHADHDPWFQAGVLFMLEKLLQQHQTSAQNYAYLYDRVAVNLPALGMKQRYGTQVKIEANGKMVLYPYEGDLANVDQRRREIGLPSIDTYLHQLKAFYHPK